jgi:hypothetical protein
MDRDDVATIQDYMVKKVGEIMPEHVDCAAEIIQNYAHDWEDVAKENSNTLCYKSYAGLPSLLASAEEESKLSLPKILNSLRNVDPSVNIYFKR